MITITTIINITIVVSHSDIFHVLVNISVDQHTWLTALSKEFYLRCRYSSSQSRNSPNFMEPCKFISVFTRTHHWYYPESSELITHPYTVPRIQCQVRYLFGRLKIWLDLLLKNIPVPWKLVR